MKTLLPALTAVFVVVSLGCSDSRYDYKTSIETGMSVRIRGETQKRIQYHIQEFRIDNTGYESSWESSNCQVLKSDGERFKYYLAGKTKGCTIAVLVPFDDEVTVEVLKKNKVVASKTSTQAGTILRIEIGQLPKDRKLAFEAYEPDPIAQQFRTTLLNAIQTESATEITAHPFSVKSTGEEFSAFVAELKKRYGEPKETPVEYWMLAPTPNFDMIQGCLKFGSKNIPVIFGFNREQRIDFVVVEFVTGEKWLEVAQWREQLESSDSSGG